MDAVAQLSSVQSIDDLVQVLRGSARGVCGADGITVVRREGGVVAYVAEDAIGRLWTGERFVLRNCISGLAMLENRAILIPDIYADARVPHAAYAATFVRSMAMFPVGTHDPQMAIGAYWRVAGETDPESVSLLSSLAHAAGMVFDRLERPGKPLQPRLDQA